MDKQAFADRLMACEQTLYRVSCAMLREEADRRDALQETALRAFGKRHTLRDPALFSTWVTRILINECRNIQRRQQRISPVEDVFAVAEEASANAGPSDLRRTLDALPERHRLPLLLHYLEGYSLAEIAQILRIPLGTVKYRLHAARKVLRVQLEDEEVR